MDGGWFEPIRAYCERADAGFWAEPVNAVSNGAFLLAAAAAVRRVGSERAPDPAALGLAALVALVGIGSFLFHTFANRWSLLADVVPIGLFIYAYFGLAMRRYFGLSIPVAVAATALFAVFNLGFSAVLDRATGLDTAALSNGSIDYVPAVLALVGVGSALRVRDGSRPPAQRAGTAILAVGTLFLVSLGLRTADAAACPWLPVGTHALWHVLNAAVLYGLIAVAVRYRGAGDETG